MLTKAVYIDTDMAINLQGLADDVGAAIPDATVTTKVFNSSNTQLGSTISLPATAISGNYQGFIPNDIGWSEDALYTIVILAEKGGTQLTIKLNCKGEYYGG